MTKFSDSVYKIRYAIRDLVPLAREVERQGKKVIYLNIGDPLKYDFKTPRHIIEMMYKASLSGYNYYSDSQGIYELREAISHYLKKRYSIDAPPEHIVVTNGVAEAINFVVRLFTEPGDEYLVPGPSYPSYIFASTLYHSRAREYRCIPEDGFQPDVDDIRSKITPRTRFILLNTPNNPTGALYSPKVLREVMDVAAEYNLPVISDEIYDRIILNGVYTPPHQYVDDILYIGLNGFSKQFLMTGWRLGYIYIIDNTGNYVDKAVEGILKQARSRLSPNTPAQYGAIAALKGGDKHLKELIFKLRRRTSLFYKLVSETEGMEVHRPKATFYIFPKIDKKIYGDDREFASNLLRHEGVYIVPGSGFGVYGENHFRAVTLAPENLIEEAFHRIWSYLKRLGRLTQKSRS